MLNHDTTSKIVTMENKALRAVVDYTDGLVVREFSNLASGKTTNKDRELFVFTIYGKEYTAKDFVVADVTTAQDKKWDLVTFLLTLDAEKVKIRFNLLNDKESSITLLYQIWDDYKLGVPSVSLLRLPFLAQLESGDATEHKYFPAGVAMTDEGTDAMVPMIEGFHSADILLPLVVCDSNEQYGFSVQFPSLSDLNDAGATQNVNKQLTTISSDKELKEHCLRVNPDASFNDTVELRITGISKGWPEAFDHYRTTWQSNYDFSEYDREDLQWFNDCVVHNFVFLYGKEGFDHDNQRIDVDGLLAQGDDFGGYDTVTIWNQYPRLGIDTRTQWEFYDDFPGGRPALKEAVRKFHDKGVPVFLPYIPWDRGNDETTNTMGDEFARIVADTNADGYQLDTMRDLPFSWRKKLDDIRPGIVLTTQHHPLKKHPVEFITTSWDEFWRFDPMPEVDVFRFICPRHIAPVISRWLRLEDKTVLIKRCEFGAAPIVIWQDIFGRWMPFSDEQKARIKTWKEAYLKYREIYQGTRPIPLMPTGTKGAYCNLFAADDSGDQIYSFYNDTAEPCAVKGFKVYDKDAKTAQIVLGDGKAELADNALTVTIQPKEVLHVLVK